MASSYESFALHYDEVMGDRQEVARQVAALIRRHHPRAKSVLELGCGTGSMLKLLSKSYRVTGLDLSSSMLSVARQKVPKALLLRQDITRFQMHERYDVIICVFDTMNHITSFTDWKRIFKRARAHLNPGGLFLFDVNTAYKLERYSSELGYAESKHSSISIIDVIRTARHRYRLDLKLLRKAKGELYELFETSVHELAVPTERIIRALKRQYSCVTVLDPERSRPIAESEELYFICSA